ncbi:iron-containing alcohol dehydrogenase [Acidiphilium sp.]|uniref:iron-containing alcohol dehydrogenase n=1 Tax=Acidiphilium sp. TaxID=527 RepID=UPI003D0906AD
MTMNIFAPRFIDIGAGASARIAVTLSKLGVQRPLIVTDPVMMTLGLIGRITEPLDQAGIHAVIFGDTVPEPVDTIVDAGVRFAIDRDIDCIIAFGGGSPIDTAKAINILLAAPEGSRMRAFKVPFAADVAALPLIAVPTTAGTGSEATRFTVITDTETDEKMLIGGLGALPSAAIVDFELSMSVPARTTADTGIDAFTHALEAFVSRRANPVSDAYARAALGLIGSNLRAVYHEPENRAARESMMLGATLAGLAFSNASVALVHGMSRPIGAHFHVPHGLSNAMLLPAVTRYSLHAALPRYAEAARLAGFAQDEDADQVAGAKLVDELETINFDLGVPTPEAFGIVRAAWDAQQEVMAAQALASGSPANNPLVPDAAEIIRLYADIY